MNKLKTNISKIWFGFVFYVIVIYHIPGFVKSSGGLIALTKLEYAIDKHFEEYVKAHSRFINK